MSPRKAGADSIKTVGESDWVFEVEFHPAQQEIWASKARFKMVAAGRRFGKSLFGIAFLLIKATSKPRAVVMWVSPSHDQSRMIRDMIANIIPQQYREVNKTLNEIYLPNGSILLFRSGERSDNLRGWGLDAVVLDEAAFIEENVWTEVIRPALADKKGHALLISTYDGENWFYQRHRDAKDPDNKEWESWEFTSYANPYLDPAEIDEARASLPKEVADQEFMASPMAFSGAVFSGEKLAEAWERGKAWDEPITTHVVENRLVRWEIAEAGLDWGWNVTALEVCLEDANGCVTWTDEYLYERIELSLRCEAIARACKEHNIATIYADAADPTANSALAIHLERVGLPTEVQPVPFAAYKSAGIQTRNFYLERGREAITPNCSRLFTDSKAYHWDPAGEKAIKSNDHTCDAVTAFYSSRSYQLGGSFGEEEAV